MATQTTTSTPDFMTGFKQTFPEYASMDNATLSKNILSKLSSPDSSKFISSLKQRMPKISGLQNDFISKSIKDSLSSEAQKGGLSSGNQATDLGLQTGAEKLGIDKNPIIKAGKSVFDFITSLPQALGENVGASSQAPANVQKYSDALQTNLNLTYKLQQQIQKDKSQGKDTSKLEKALADNKNSIPKISDFLDQTTLRRLNESTGKNVEEVIGQGLGTVLDTTLGGSLETGGETAISGTKSLLGKIGTGAKIGATYGSIGGASQSLAQEQSAGNVAKNTVMGGVLGAGIGAGSEAIVGGITNKIKTGSVLNLGKIPEKVSGEEGALLSVPDAKEQILEAQKLTKENIKNPDLPTASDVQGNKVHQSILTKAKAQLDSIGKKMSDSLSGIVGEAKTDIGDFVSKLQEDLKDRPPVSTSPDKKTSGTFLEDLRKLMGKGETIPTRYGGEYEVPGTGKNATLKDIDNFLRKWQSTDLSSKMQNNSVGALYDSFVHNLNEYAKNVADKAETDAGIAGHPYRESNDEYSRLISDYNDAKDQLGTNRTSTGKYDKSGNVFRENSTANSSPAWKNLANATKIPLGQPASLTTLIEDIYRSSNPADAITNTRISYNPFLAIARTALSLLGKAEKDPDAIVAKMIQLIDESKGKLTGKIK